MGVHFLCVDKLEFAAAERLTSRPPSGTTVQRPSTPPYILHDHGGAMAIVTFFFGNVNFKNLVIMKDEITFTNVHFAHHIFTERATM